MNDPTAMDVHLIERLAGQEGGWVTIITAVMAITTFAAMVSERFQKILGPVGRWLRTRHRNAVKDQADLEKAMLERHSAQIRAMEEEVEWYRRRYEQVLDDLDTARRKEGRHGAGR